MSTYRRPPEYSRSPDRRQRTRDDDFSSLYKLGHEIGIGADSAVYECRNLSTSEKCAVKVTDITKADLKMLQEESDLLCQLSHENIVKGYGIHVTWDKVNIVVELIEGEELHSIINQSGGLQEEDAIPLIYQLVNAVIYLHDNKICHRDIKPENILVSEDGTLKLIDFGLAARLDGTDGTMRACVGTQAYQAPEVLVGLPYTQGIDMWAVGATVYTLLSGTKPFGYGPLQSDTPGDGPFIPTSEQKSYQRAKILNGDFNFNDSVWEKISENGKDFVLRLLKVRPSDRMTPQEAFNHPWLSSEEIDFRSWHFKWRSKSRDRREACRREKREKGLTHTKSTTQRESYNDKEEPSRAPIPRAHEALSISQRKLKSQSVMCNTKLALSMPEVNSRSSTRQLTAYSHRPTQSPDTDHSTYSQSTDRHTERSERPESTDRSDRYTERYSKRTDRSNHRTERSDRPERSERSDRYERTERPERPERTDYSRLDITPTRVSYHNRTTLTPTRSSGIMTMSRHSEISSPGSSRRKKF